MTGAPVTAIDLLFYLTPVVVFLLAFGAGANAVGAALGLATGAGVLDLRPALLLGGAIAAVAAVLLGASGGTDWVGALLPGSAFDTPEHRIYALFAGLLATAITALGASALALPTPLLPAFAGALAAVVLVESGGPAIDWLPMIVLVGGLVATPLVALGIGCGLFAFVQRYTLTFWRPRDRLRLVIPLLAAALALVAALLVAATLPIGLSRAPVWLVPAVAGGLAAVAGLTSWWTIRSRPFWVTNDRDGAEAAFVRLSVAGPTLLVVATGAWQTLTLAAPGAVLMALVRAAGPAAAARSPGLVAEPFILVAVVFGLLLGVILMGHRTAETVGERIAPLSESRGAVAALAAALVLSLGGPVGAPVAPTLAIGGATMGVRVIDGQQTPEPGRIPWVVVAWLAVMPVGAVFGLILYGVCRAVMP